MNMKRSAFVLVLVAAGCIVSVNAARAQTCPLAPWMTFRGTHLWRSSNGQVYAYRTEHVAIDADGAPRAYCPGDTGLDFLKNAGFPGPHWADVLIADPAKPDRPFVQRTGPGQGCYLAGTSLRSKTDTDAASYVDALTVPYMVFPTGFLELPGTGFVGDFAAMRSADGQHVSAAIVADTGGGSKARLGEVSVALAHALGAEKASPRTGATGLSMPITVVVFRSTRKTPAWPVALTAIEEAGRKSLEAIGGWDAIASCALN